MKKNVSYSIAIRTLGTAGEKYERLLASVSKLTIQPEKVIVVLPKGYNCPPGIFGKEQIVFSEKGMIPQRIKALEYIDSTYTLFCDDDVEFEETFIEKLAVVLERGKYTCASGPLLDFFPNTTIKAMGMALLGGACIMVHGRKDTYVRLLKTGGWSYNRGIEMEKNRVYKTESLAGTCFMARTEAMKRVRLDVEKWAEKNGYAAFEDRIMIGKLLVNGYRTCVVSDAKYIHNDGKTATKRLGLEPAYAAAYNHYVFWHRYIYSMQQTALGRIWSRICITYYVIAATLYQYVAAVVFQSNSTKDKRKMKFEAVRNGFRDAKVFIKSREYESLPSAAVNKKRNKI